MYYLVSQEYRGGPVYLVSEHRSLMGAVRAMVRHEADPYWKAYIYSVVLKKPERSHR